MTPSIGFTEYMWLCRNLGIKPTNGSPAERMEHIPDWLNPELASTQAARDRLTAWSHRVPNAHTARPPSADEVLATAEIVGDISLAHRASKVIAALPPPVASFIVDETTILGVGTDAVGFMGPHPVRDRRPTFIVVCHMAGAPYSFDALMAHECAHAWLEPAPGSHVTMRRALWHYVALDGQLGAAQSRPGAIEVALSMRSEYAQAERQCLALTRRWGFLDVWAEARRE